MGHGSARTDPWPMWPIDPWPTDPSPTLMCGRDRRLDVPTAVITNKTSSSLSKHLNQAFRFTFFTHLQHLTWMFLFSVTPCIMLGLVGAVRLVCAKLLTSSIINRLLLSLNALSLTLLWYTAAAATFFCRQTVCPVFCPVPSIFLSLCHAEHSTDVDTIRWTGDQHSKRSHSRLVLEQEQTTKEIYFAAMSNRCWRLANEFTK